MAVSMVEEGVRRCGGAAWWRGYVPQRVNKGRSREKLWNNSTVGQRGSMDICKRMRAYKKGRWTGEKRTPQR